MTDYTDRSTKALLARRAIAEEATPGAWWAETANSPDMVIADIDEILRLRAAVERLEKEADWLATAAANGGWHGVRVSPDQMREAARKAVEEPCPKN